LPALVDFDSFYFANLLINDYFATQEFLFLFLFILKFYVISLQALNIVVEGQKDQIAKFIFDSSLQLISFGWIPSNFLKVLFFPHFK
jgi:hypothetical protein